MCGIAGILSSNTSLITKEKLVSMADAIRHRGPDGEGYWMAHSGNIGLAHRRLSVIDLSESASQPMHYAGRYTIVYNGEIYNYPELRARLQKKGFLFRTQSDTEVILAAYDNWKNDCLQYFDGMFSLAIWDQQEQLLFCARDRFGEKPFYYYHDKKLFAFASEMKALWQIGIKKKADDKMLLNYLALGNVQNPKDKQQTFFEGISSLPPAAYFTYRITDNVFHIQQYWDINKDYEGKITADDAINTFSELLTRSVKRRMRSDIPVGTSLSGGLDSSSIVAVINSLNNNESPLKTFSAVFPGFEKDESNYIQSVTDRFPIENYQVTPSADDLIKNFEKICYHQEEPFSSSSIYAQFSIYELAAKNQIKVVLDGQGADESLAGYTRYLHWHLQQLLSRSGFSVLNKERKLLKERNIPFYWDIRNYIATIFPSHVAIFLEKRDYRKLAANPDIDRSFLQSLSRRGQEGISKPIVTTLNDILYYNITQNGLEELLRFADRNAMAHGVEVRLPFLQHELVEYIFSLPAGYKIHEGWTKWILRKMMDKKLPQEIVWRTNKIGYEPPQNLWMQSPRMQDYIHEARKKLVANNILNQKALTKKIKPMDAHAADNFDWRYLSAAQIL